MKTLLIAILGCLLTVSVSASEEEPVVRESTNAARIEAIEQRAAELKARTEQVVAEVKDDKPAIRKRPTKPAYDATMPMANEQPVARK